MSTNTVSLPSAAQTALLDWSQRPESLKSAIDKYHAKESEFTESYSNPISDKSHGVCNINEFTLVKKLILQAYPAQKEFNVLEVGARRFAWCQALADFIEKQTDLPQDIKVHIIGIRNEKYLGERVVETDRCKISRLGAFHVEELFAKFKEEKLDLENKVDMAISHWSIRDRYDPVGTVLQTIHLLRPKSGYLLVDGFFFLCNDEQMNGKNPNAPNIRLTQLFLDLKAPFVTKYVDIQRSLNHFILKRPDENPCRLPMSYLDTCEVDGHAWRIDSHTVTRFKRDSLPTDEDFYVPSKFNAFHGDKSLFEWLRKSDVFHCESDYWQPLQPKDDHLKMPPLHQAVAGGDLVQIEKLLDEGHDVDESCTFGTKGDNPLHIAISKVPNGDKYYDVFEALMKRGPNLNLFNSLGRAPLHEAVSLKDPRAMQALIGAGANVNAKAWGNPSPLDVAIQVKNNTAIELLTKSGATISEQNKKDLTKAGYFNLHVKMRLTAMVKV